MRTIRITGDVCALTFLLALGACGAGPGQTSNPGNPGDTTAPTISITSPTASGSYSTGSATVALAGTASDNVGVTSVTWRNAANNASGSATGTGSWSIASVALVSGVNAITVTAHDAAGNTGGAPLTVTYNPGGTSSLSGNVDSSLINRNAANTVYIYSGMVTPSGATTPFATTPATQDNGACTFSYQFGALPANTYTVAVSNDGTTFRGISTVNVPATSTYNFPPNRLLRVGPTRTGPNTFTVPSAAIAAAQTGDVIEIDAGEYVDDNSVWGVNNLTLRGVGGGRAHMRSTQLIGNGKGIWVTSNNATVENIEFSGAAVSINNGENGAGIRADGSGLTVCNGYFHDNQNGILDASGVVLVEYSEFNHNGQCPPTNNCSHNMYFSTTVTRFTLRYSYSHRAHEGHLVKSRAIENYILYNRITDEDGDASYEIDLPNGGLSFIIGNVIEQSASTGNSAIIAYGEEGVTAGHQTQLYVVNNTIVNNLGSGAFISSLPGGTTARIVNNIFAGGGSLPAASGTVTLTSNLSANPTSQAGLVNPAAFDYRLTSGSPARNMGTDPGTVGSVSLTPTSQYLHPANREDRPVNGTIDIGAYEFQ
jgi:hypothetical protein